MSAELYRNALAAGYRLHWYRIERVLGQGGFGITYLALDTNLQQFVAVKEFLPAEIAVRGLDLSIQPKAAADEEQYRSWRQRFLSEARTLARFDHSSIVRAYSVFEANNTAYLVMRYEEGESLNAILKRRERLPEDELLAIVLPILEGLKKVHDLGFVHRDCQPANIFIRKDGSPVLLDFGAARQSVGKARTLTILVAPGYAPFEQYYSSSAEQGPWTDIYGLGATLYRAVAGVAPIDAIERSRGMLGSSRDVLVPASVAGKGRYSDHFLAAIDHALEFHERDRPQTLEDWARELRGESPPAARSGNAVIGVRAAPPAQSRPAAALQAAETPPLRLASRRSAAAALLAAAAGIGLYAWQTGDGELKPETGGTPAAAVDAAAPAKAMVRSSPMVVLEQQPAGAPATAMADAAEAERSSVMPAGDGAAAAEQSEDAASVAELPDVKAAREMLQRELQELEARRIEEERRVSEAEARWQTLIEERRQEEARRREAAAAAQAPLPEAPPPGRGPAQPPSAEPVAAGNLERGVAALQAGNHAEARRLLEPLAQQGNAVAQFSIGDMYRSGRGVRPDLQSALDWMRKAAWQGHLEAQVALARIYLEGAAGRQDAFLAYTWFLLAERNGAYEITVERDQAERLLQEEQIEQASSLAADIQRTRIAIAAAKGGQP